VTEGFPVFNDKTIKLRWAFYDKEDMSELEQTEEFFFNLNKCRERLKAYYKLLDQYKILYDFYKAQFDDGKRVMSMKKVLKAIGKDIKLEIKDFCINFPVAKTDFAGEDGSLKRMVNNYDKFDLRLKRIAVKIGFNTMTDSTTKVSSQPSYQQKRLSVDFRSKAIKISNLPQEYLTNAFIRNRIYQYGYVTKTVFFEGDIYVEFAARYMAENALAEREFLGSTVTVEIFNGSLDNIGKNKEPETQNKESETKTTEKGNNTPKIHSNLNKKEKNDLEEKEEDSSEESYSKKKAKAEKELKKLIESRFDGSEMSSE